MFFSKINMSCCAILICYIFLGNLCFAASPDFCQKYANTARSQFSQAMSLGMPGIVFPVWSDDYQHHYSWCLTASEQEVIRGQEQRSSAIQTFLADLNKSAPSSDDHSSSSPSGIEQGQIKSGVIIREAQPLPQSNLGKIAEAYKTPEQIHPKIKKKCEDYADQSVLQQNQNIDFQCLEHGPEWSEKKAYHYNWCIKGDNHLSSELALKKRKKKISICRKGANLLPPEIVIGLRGVNKGNEIDPFVAGYLVYKEEPGHTYSTNIIRDCFTGNCECKNYNDCEWNTYNVGQLRYMSHCFPSYKQPQDYILPPGVVIGLSNSYADRWDFQYDYKKDVTITSHNCEYPYPWTSALPDSSRGSVYLPGGTFQKFCINDTGGPSTAKICWYESTGLGFTDWSLATLLPRGTVIGLNHSVQKINKKYFWDGKLINSLDPNSHIPFGYVRKFAHERGASINDGFYWFEKIIGE